MWVKGSENGDCVKAWLDCNRIVNYEDSYKQATKDKFLANNAGWTSEMYDTAMSLHDKTKFIQGYDYGYGISSEMELTFMPAIYQGIADQMFESWVQAREECSGIIDEEIKVYNDN